MSDWKPHDAPEDAPNGTMLTVPRVVTHPGAPAPQNPPVAAQSQPPPARPFSFGSLAMPSASPVEESGSGTMVGIGRVAMPNAAPAPQPFDAGGTMVGIGRVAMPNAAPAPQSFDAGGTMVGTGRVPMPNATAAPPSFDAGGTMVGIGRVPMANASLAPRDAGGTMVGIGRVPLANAAPAPVGVEADAGGTMVGIGRVAVTPSALVPPPPRPTGPPPAYEIVAHLGGGELGQVFHARRRDNGEPVALRIIRPDIAAVPGADEALRQVAELASHAVHGNLGRILAFDETASPTLVLEYVPGKKLATLMQERGAAPAPAVIDLGIRLCSALAATHGAGLAHGRVHAGNVIIEQKTGRWVLLDMAHGYCLQDLEPAHDLYALGALLYQMATGRDPFETDPVKDPRTYAPRLPAALSALLMRTLAPDPALWFGSAIELAQALVRAKALP